MEVERGAADEAASLSGVEEDYVDRDPSAPLPPSNRPSRQVGPSPGINHGFVVGIIILVLAGYCCRPRFRQKPGRVRAGSGCGVAELMRKIERTTETTSRRSRHPEYVRQLKLNKNDAIQATDTVRVLVTNGKARFSRA